MHLHTGAPDGEELSQTFFEVLDALDHLLCFRRCEVDAIRGLPRGIPLETHPSILGLWKALFEGFPNGSGLGKVLQ